MKTARKSRLARPVGTTSKTRDADTDRALIALFIGAMDANGHVSPHQASRAHHLIWSTRRFRRRSGDAMGRLIESVRAEFSRRDHAEVVAAATTRIPARLRRPAFAVVADLLLNDGRIDPQERRFLQRLGADLRLTPEVVRQVLAVMLLKNSL
jgi:tellurite resistance protein